MKLKSKYSSEIEFWKVDEEIFGLIENGLLKHCINDKILVHFGNNGHRTGYIAIIKDDKEGNFLGVRFHDGSLNFYSPSEVKKKRVGSIFSYEPTAYPRFTLVRKFGKAIKLIDNGTGREYEVGETVMLSANFVKDNLDGTTSFKEDYLFGLIVGFTNNEGTAMVAVKMYNDTFGLIDPYDLANNGY